MPNQIKERFFNEDGFLSGMHTITNEGAIRLTEYLAEGSTSAADLDAISVLRPAVKHGFRKILILHNHPSGSCLPSVEDAHFSRSLSAAASALGVTLVDHLIIGEREIASALK